MKAFQGIQTSVRSSSPRLGRQLAWGTGLIVFFLLTATSLNHLYLGQIHQGLEGLEGNLNEQKFLAQLSFQIASCQEWERRMQTFPQPPDQRAQAVEAWYTASNALLDTLESKGAPVPTAGYLTHSRAWKPMAEQYIKGMTVWLEENTGVRSAAAASSNSSAESLSSAQSSLENLRRCVEIERTRAQSKEQASIHRLQFLLSRHMQWTAAWMIVALGVVGIAVIWIYVYVLRRVRVLTETAHRLANGQTLLRLKGNNRDELGQLASQLNYLAEKLGSRCPEDRSCVSRSQVHQLWSRWIAQCSERLHHPLQKIHTYSEMLAHSLHQPEQLQAISAIQQNNEWLRKNLENCQLWAQLESGLISPHPRPFSPRQLITQTVSRLQLLAESKGLQLQIEGEEAVPEQYVSDPLLLEKILIHLVGVSIETTDVGEIGIRIRHLPEESPPCLQIQVIDRGKGLTPEELAQLSGPCPSKEDEVSPPLETIGWTVCRRFVDFIGGQLEAESIPGCGSTFTLKVPMRESDGSFSASQPTDSARGLIPQDHPIRTSQLQGRVLVAEDGPENQRLIGFILRKAGLEVEIVSDGQEAVDRVLQRMASSAEPPYDLILMDMLMPRLDGVQATQRIRQAGYSGPILAVTGAAQNYSRTQCLEAGCNDYLAKPFEREQFLSIVRKYLAHSLGQNSTPSDSPAGSISS